MIVVNYDRERAVTYAGRWAFLRNPLFYDYTGIGGNCTNFVSQCVFAGCCTMNFLPVFGWYYLSDSERTASWTGVTYFYNFLVGNTGEGPFGRQVAAEECLVGDVIQLYRASRGWYHTLLVVGFAEGVPLVAAHSIDAYGRALDTYEYDAARYLHIEGARRRDEDGSACFDALYNAIAILPDDGSVVDATDEEDGAADENEAGGQNENGADESAVEGGASES